MASSLNIIAVPNVTPANNESTYSSSKNNHFQSQTSQIVNSINNFQIDSRVWRVHPDERYFERIDNSEKWREMFDGICVFSFAFVKRNGDETVLLKNDGSFLRLNSKSLHMGYAMHECNRLSYFGTWIFKNNNLSDYCTWRAKTNDHFFKKVKSNEWSEYRCGIRCFDFRFIEEEGNEIILMKIDDVGNVLKLNSKEIRIGMTKDRCNRLLYNGTWLTGLELEEQVRKQFSCFDDNYFLYLFPV